ncbi:MAG: SDR family oxidoreductase [Gammaproteobacteria bacterium]|jgi:uncharacterized protein YbjT (DUF2867 family)|nr:SDR family oxidoreductase [Gammaproteobacteria bacterium]
MKSIMDHCLRFIAHIFLLLLIVSGVARAETAHPAGESNGLVLVAGATGGTGREIVKHLLSNNFNVRAMVRNESRARDLFGDDITYVVADVRQPDEIIEAMKDVHYVVTAIGATRGDKTNSPEFVDYGGVRNLADVAKALEIKQFVLVSSSGVTDEDHFLNKMFNNVLQWKLKGENALRASGVPYTIVRPGGLVNKPGGKAVIVFSQGDTSAGTITREDVAMICVASLQYTSAVNKTFETYSETGEYSANWQAMFGSLKAD